MQRNPNKKTGDTSETPRRQKTAIVTDERQNVVTKSGPAIIAGFVVQII
jgi:hypothetical protein